MLIFCTKNSKFITLYLLAFFSLFLSIISTILQVLDLFWLVGPFLNKLYALFYISRPNYRINFVPLPISFFPLKRLIHLANFNPLSIWGLFQPLGGGRGNFFNHLPIHHVTIVEKAKVPSSFSCPIFKSWLKVILPHKVLYAVG